jgi:hypothetical protein
MELSGILERISREIQVQPNALLDIRQTSEAIDFEKQQNEIPGPNNLPTLTELTRRKS